MDPIRDRIARLRQLKGQGRQDDETNRRTLQNKAREIVQKNNSLENQTDTILKSEIQIKKTLGDSKRWFRETMNTMLYSTYRLSNSTPNRFYSEQHERRIFRSSQIQPGSLYCWFYNPKYGALSLVLGFFGLDPIPMLADENLATYGIIIASFFPGIAYTMILYITGLTGVSREMIEAGRIDGASGFTMLWHVVLPQLRAATLIAIVVTLVGALRAFDLIAVMTAGGPWGSSEVLAYKMYQEALFNYRMGYGAAIATILFLIMDIYIAWFLYRLFKRESTEK